MGPTDLQQEDGITVSAIFSRARVPPRASQTSWANLCPLCDWWISLTLQIRKWTLRCQYICLNSMSSRDGTLIWDPLTIARMPCVSQDSEQVSRYFIERKQCPQSSYSKKDTCFSKPLSVHRKLDRKTCCRQLPCHQIKSFM